ncbi:PEP-utilizing protein [Peribacillus asahii]|uniref:PEP-utilizing protein n=1 Tax=Peribacillus asahii TaxID=228899 RepID=A0A398BFX6_9BACI|nr:PEP-utilizing enzyme [Peribacillus asahii]RID88677.1 PEP-utilizing protein [Peribacillus asahii]
MFNTQTFRNELLLSEEDKQNGFWFLDELHLPGTLTPLFASYMAPAVTEGTKKAYETLKLPIHQFHIKISDSHYYQNTVPYKGDIEKRIEENAATERARFSTLSERFWKYMNEELQPQFMKMDNYRANGFTLAQAGEILVELFTFYKRAWEIHFEVVMPRGSLGLALEDAYKNLTGDVNTTYVYDLVEGVMNKSLETDRAIWKLAKSVKDSAVLLQVFNEAANEELVTMLQASPEGQEFLLQLQEVLNIYGWRIANSHEFSDETWVENPVYILEVISEYLKKDYDFDEEFARVVAEREQKVAELLEKYPESEAKAAFKQIHEWALAYWGVDEDHHFYIDAMLPAKSRMLLLEVGTLLVEAKVIEVKEDIFFLYLDELVDVVNNPIDITAKIIERKAEHIANSKKEVPSTYGVPPQEEVAPVIERIFGTKAAEVSEEERSFKGYAASKGIHKGTVKVVRDQNDFSKVHKGDVLVCKTTLPPWTVLFSIAGAVITDAGGILSHAGTVAREYKLPAVLGTKLATQMLKDGDIVTVDGTNGVVYIGNN